MSIDDKTTVALITSQETLLKTLCISVMETVRFYADNGDLLSAAYIALVFHSEVTEEPKLAYFSLFLRRILKSYFDAI